MEVKGWHFVGCPVAIEREAGGPAQEVAPHGLTERLLPDRLPLHGAPLGRADPIAHRLGQSGATSVCNEPGSEG